MNAAPAIFGAICAGVAGTSWAITTRWFQQRTRQGVTHPLEEMPGHPEQIGDLPDPVEDEAYWDIAEELLDDGLADVAERTGWTK